jgi:glycine/betaine/sarcosine/D-proline reductase family selenoprotein B
MKKAIYYLNQFFGQIGGEDKADFAPEIKEGILGPGLLLSSLLSPELEVTHTVICGDNFFGSRKEEAIEIILDFLADKEFDVFIAGPAFMAGRYGVACGEICKAVKERFGVPAVTGMYHENPAVEMFHKDVYIFLGGSSAASMRKELPIISNFVKKLVSGETLLSAREEGYFPTGVRLESFANPPFIAADRVVDMLIKKINGHEFETEIPMPRIDSVPIATAIEDLSQATVALVNSGGIVPVGNPDRIQSASATKWGKYDITEKQTLLQGEWETIHAGFDPSAANNNPNVIVPLDALRFFEREGKIGRVHEFVYSTVGTGTTQADARRMGEEIALQLKEANVSAVVLTST